MNTFYSILLKLLLVVLSRSLFCVFYSKLCELINFVELFDLYVFCSDKVLLWVCDWEALRLCLWKLCMFYFYLLEDNFLFFIFISGYCKLSDSNMVFVFFIFFKEPKDGEFIELMDGEFIILGLSYRIFNELIRL